MGNQQRTEQLFGAIEGLATVSATLGGMRTQLIEAGFTPEAAEDLVIMLMSANLQQELAAKRVQPQPFLRGATFKLPPPTGG